MSKSFVSTAQIRLHVVDLHVISTNAKNTQFNANQNHAKF